MRYVATHITGYTYSEPASLSQNELFLFPRTTGTQRVLEYSLSITPEPDYRHRRTDYFGNTADLFMVQRSHSKLVVAATSTVQTASPNVPDPDQTPAWEEVAARLAACSHANDFEALPYLFASPFISLSSRIRSYAHRSFQPATPLLRGTLDLMQRIFKGFAYDKSASTIDTTVEQVMEKRIGVCQDFAHLAISCLRSLGLAARYVSGYLETIPAPGKPKLVGSDASHAWVSVFIPDLGWVDFDPTNNLVVDQSHITLAWGRDYGDVAPVKGVVMGGGTHSLSVSVSVEAQHA